MLKISLILGALLMPFMAEAKVDAKLVERAETYLNNISGLEGGFTQKVGGGKEEFGKFYMLRPGKIRLDYDKLPIQLISDGKNLFFYDKSLDQITTIPSSSTPASVLARKTIDLTGADIKVMESRQFSGGFELKLNLKNNPGLGEMKVLFGDSPVALKGWELKDATGSKTEVELSGLKTRTDFPKGFWNVQKHRVNTTGTGDKYYE
ncbi:MAG: outer membrane lipoprotein carrier protein LolA [Rickettsiales bacterium]|jgi:outer membrane lipoprotein-sorting protein|nr:outer membrane lipoprotein carrier protein LolA [Rickettsiales bacterium]